ARGRPAVDRRRARAAAPRPAGTDRAAARPALGALGRGRRGRRPVRERRGDGRRRRRRARPARRARRRLGPGAARQLPRVRAWDRSGARPIVRLEADRGATVVDGGADALAGLAAFGALPGGRIAYAGDATASDVRRAGEVVISD